MASRGNKAGTKVISQEGECARRRRRGRENKRGSKHQLSAFEFGVMFLPLPSQPGRKLPGEFPQKLFLSRRKERLGSKPKVNRALEVKDA